MKTVDIGRLGEDAAARFIKKQRFKILERNLHISHNEIDLIAISKKKRLLLFIEVKTRTVDSDLYSPFGTPASAVNKEKQQRTITAAKGFIRTNLKYFDFQPRFDVIEVYLEKDSFKILKINHIENAFCV